MIDWKSKLTSRKFWSCVASFVVMLMVFFGENQGQAEKVAALIMAGASVIAYIFGESYADAAAASQNFGIAEEAEIVEDNETDDLK